MFKNIMYARVPVQAVFLGHGAGGGNFRRCPENLAVGEQRGKKKSRLRSKMIRLQAVSRPFAEFLKTLGLAHGRGKEDRRHSPCSPGLPVIVNVP
jgi:hypothetical protein